MVFTRHLISLALVTFTGADASWFGGQAQNAESVQDSAAQILARSPQGPGGGRGGGGRGGPPGGKGGGRGGGGGRPPGGFGPPGGAGRPGGPFGNGRPPFFNGGPPFQQFPLETLTITAGSVGYTSTILTTDRFGRPTEFVLVDVPTEAAGTTEPSQTHTTVTTTAPLLTITRNFDGATPFTETILTEDAFGALTQVVIVNVPTNVPITSTSNALLPTTTASSAPLLTITRTLNLGPFEAFTETISTTDAFGRATAFVLVNVPAVATATTTGMATATGKGNISTSSGILGLPTSIIGGLPTSIIGGLPTSIIAAVPLLTITQTVGNVANTQTLPTTDAAGNLSSFVLVTEPTLIPV